MEESLTLLIYDGRHGVSKNVGGDFVHPLYVCVCVYICMYVCMYVCAIIYMCIYMYVRSVVEVFYGL